MAQKEDTLYLRNARPNRIAFVYGGHRYLLEHRGNRADSTSLPIEAAQDATVSRWLKNGQLEKISQNAFMKLGTRQVDVVPTEFLKQQNLTRSKGVGMKAPDKLTGYTQLNQLEQDDVHETVRKTRLEWAGDLMTTDEELEVTDYESKEHNYPSKHRGSDARREMGY